MTLADWLAQDIQKAYTVGLRAGRADAALLPHPHNLYWQECRLLGWRLARYALVLPTSEERAAFTDGYLAGHAAILGSVP